MNNAESEDIKWIEIDSSLPGIQPEADSEKKDKWHYGNDDKYGLKTELLYVCSPERFMNPYDSLRVGKAIELYKQIRAINPDDIEALSAVRLVAEQELDVKLDVEAFYEHLIDVFSPAPYVKNYNAKLLEKHHAICTQFTESKDDITALEQTLKMLLTENTEKVGDAEKVDSTEMDAWMVGLGFLILFEILIVIVVCSY